MPTYDRTPQFLKEFARLTPEQRLQFKAAVQHMIEDLNAKRPFRTSLGVERFESVSSAYEMKWAGDGRALFSFGKSIHEGEAHIIWISVGTHKIYKR